MSKPDKQTHRDFSIFDTMRTEELEEILFQDSQLPEEASDESAILYIADERESPGRGRRMGIVPGALPA